MRGLRTAAVIGASTLVGAAAAVFSMRELLRRQAAIARRRIGKPLGEDALDADRVWRAKLDGDPVELLVLGDSIAAGLGVTRRKDTPGARISKGIAETLGRPVRLVTAAKVGSESSALAAQLNALPARYAPDVAIIIVGGNDVTHRVPVTVAAAHLRAAVERLRERGVAVVVGTCPDLGAHGSRASWPTLRPRRRSPPARTSCRSDVSSGPSSSRSPTRCSASTGSTRARSATGAPPTRCCRRCCSPWEATGPCPTGTRCLRHPLSPSEGPRRPARTQRAIPRCVPGRCAGGCRVPRVRSRARRRRRRRRPTGGRRRARGIRSPR